MRIKMISKALSMVILCSTAYSLYWDYQYGFSWLEYFSLASIWSVGWYIYSYFAITLLFREKRSGWFLGNAWLVWLALTQLTSYLFLFYLLPAESLSQEDQGPDYSMIYFLFYLLGWYVLNRSAFTTYYGIGSRDQVRASVIPALLVIFWFVYNAIYLLQ